MSNKLNRDQILTNILQTLIDGWGRAAVIEALDRTASPKTGARSDLARPETVRSEPKAVQLVENLELPAPRKELLIQVARDFDAERAFPRMSDARAFLMSHHQNARDIKSRAQAFRKMIPILQKMSEKGLAKVIARSHHSGPAALDSISDAIRGAGEDLRGKNTADTSAQAE